MLPLNIQNCIFMKAPLIIGITGGIGSGKSTLSKLLRAAGYPVYDSDLEARKLQNEHPVIKQQIQEVFGKEIYTDEGLNRSALAKIVFDNKELLSKLNHIVHPVFREGFQNWILKHSNQRFLFLESAILFENGLNKQVDKVIVITASQEVRIRRVIKRDNISVEQILARMANQIPEEEKIKHADFVIYSDDNKPLINKMYVILEQLTVDSSSKK